MPTQFFLPSHAAQDCSKNGVYLNEYLFKKTSVIVMNGDTLTIPQSLGIHFTSLALQLVIIRQPSHVCTTSRLIQSLYSRCTKQVLLFLRLTLTL